MNLLLLEPADFVDATAAVVHGRRAEHIARVLRSAPGDSLKAGLLGGLTGEAVVESVQAGAVRLKVDGFKYQPPAPLPLELILALPRPRMMHRLLQTITTLGVARIHLLQTARVEKSYWQTPVLTPQSIREQLLLGLEQAGSTALPRVEMHKRFVPFMEDTLPGLMQDKHGFIAHPCPAASAPQPAAYRTTVLAIGPEGGFLSQEVERFVEAGFSPFSLGPRILKVETAVPVAITRLYPPL